MDVRFFAVSRLNPAFDGDLIPSRLRPSVKLLEHFVYGVNNRLRFIQLNLMPAVLDHTVHAAGRQTRQRLVLGEPLLSIVSPECPLRPAPTAAHVGRKNDERLVAEREVVDAVIAMRKERC
jgi:hypothetical protein